MDFLGIGPAELVMIVILLLLFLGPTDVVELFRKVGRGLRKLRQSPTWTMIDSTARSLRNLPNTLADETGIEDLRKDLLRGAEMSRTIGKSPTEQKQTEEKASPETSDLAAWTTPPVTDSITPPPSNIRTRPAKPADGGQNGPEEGPAPEAGESAAESTTKESSTPNDRPETE